MLEWTVPDSQYISAVELSCSAYFDSVTFITNKGVKSPKFGNGTNLGISYKMINFEGAQLIGVKGIII